MEGVTMRAWERPLTASRPLLAVRSVADGPQPSSRGTRHIAELTPVVLAYAAMADMALSWVIVCMVGATACGFPRPPDLAGDAPVDRATCFGDDPFKVCFASAP